MQSATLESLANERIPSSGSGEPILAFVARPKRPPEGELPVLLVLHEFFGLSESIVNKAQVRSLHDAPGAVLARRSLATTLFTTHFPG